MLLYSTLLYFTHTCCRYHRYVPNILVDLLRVKWSRSRYTVCKYDMIDRIDLDAVFLFKLLQPHGIRRAHADLKKFFSMYCTYFGYYLHMYVGNSTFWAWVYNCFQLGSTLLYSTLLYSYMQEPILWCITLFLLTLLYCKL